MNGVAVRSGYYLMMEGRYCVVHEHLIILVYGDDLANL